MQATYRRLTISSAVVALTLGFGPSAIAAGPAQGETSGPAAGTRTAPSAAEQKQVSNPNGATAAGAPGVSGKQGAESGAKPRGSTASRQSQTR